MVGTNEVTRLQPVHQFKKRVDVGGIDIRHLGPNLAPALSQHRATQTISPATKINQDQDRVIPSLNFRRQGGSYITHGREG